MKNISHHFANLALTAWVGSLWSIGYLAVPVLFHGQSDKQLAGMLAGQMFTSAGYLGLACGLYLLWYYFSHAKNAITRRNMIGAVALMLLITLIIQFGLQPEMANLKAQALPLDVTQSDLYARFKMLHGVSSIAYLLESLLGAFLVIQSATCRPANQS